MSTLFAGSSRSSSKNLIEFRAGKMYMKGKTVHPDKRKGLVYIYQTEDGLMHFCWKDRNTGSVEEDLIIFPDDCEYKKVSQCATGRVYVLKFKPANRVLFFWMQEPKVDKDDETCKKVNEYLSNPPAPGSSQSTGSTPNPMLASDIGSLRDTDIQNFIGSMSQQQIMQLLGNHGLANLLSPSSGGSRSSGTSSSSSASKNVTSASSSTTSTVTTASTVTASTNSTTVTATATTATTTTTAAATTTTTTSSVLSGSTVKLSKPAAAAGPIQLSDLQNILSGMTAESLSQIPVDLSSAMTAEALQPILTNEEFVKQLEPYLPQTGETLPPVDQLRGTVTSPQFQQAVSLFSNALQSGQLGPLINQFGLGNDAVLAATESDMEAFVKALGKKEKEEISKKEEAKKKEKDEDKDDDDSMPAD